VYLSTHSWYSLRYGTLPVERLVELVAKCGAGSFVLTDINNTTGIPDFIAACSRAGVRPLAGAEIRNEDDHLYTLIARNNSGFREINSFITAASMGGESFPAQAPAFNDVYVIYPYNGKLPFKLRENEFNGLRANYINLVRTSVRRTFDIQKGVILSPVTYADDKGYVLHKHLRSIDHNILISQLQPHMCASPGEHPIPVRELLEKYSSMPQVIQNTKSIIDDCSIDIDLTTIKNRSTFTGSRYDDKQLLEKLTWDGLDYRYGKNNREAIQRVRHELEIIDNLGFSSYFLITWDIIRYSMSRGFYHVGRGSGANSTVAYCLRITDVDPIELDLYFERFLNPKRKSPPDFDIDYSWKERDEVLEYIFKRYGREYTALLGAMSTFKGKSIIRELGKVYGLPKNEIDNLVSNPNDAHARDSISNRIFRIGSMMSDFPNLRTIHAGGVLISDEPITSYVALDMPPKGFPTTQWDMYVAEDIGFEKLDILSHAGSGILRRRRISFSGIVVSRWMCMMYRPSRVMKRCGAS
jgi:DNA polymerase-3 subunit alpha